MARYIDADILIDKLEELQFDAPVMTPVMKIYNVIELVEDQPTADVVEVRHGKWIKHKPDSEYIKVLHQLGIAKGVGENSIYWTCSECEHWGVLHYKYCPNCGARMDGDSDDL